MKKGFTLIELLVVITILGILVALALPNFVKAKDKAKEVEVKNNLRIITGALHRFAADYDGYYPGYIWGGTPNAWGYSGTSVSHQDLADHDHGSWSALDPLLRYGYLDEYPANPFVRDGRGMCTMAVDDPRFGCLDEHILDHVGLTESPLNSGTYMGNVLHDPNFPSSCWSALSHTTNDCQSAGTYFVGDGDPKSIDFIPGLFIYRSLVSGRFAPYAQQDQNNPTSETKAVSQGWVLAAYGSTRGTGKDYLCSPAYQLNGSIESRGDRECMPGAGANGEQAYSGDTIYGDGVPNVLMSDAWDPDNDGVIGDSKGFRFIPGNPDSLLDGIIMIVDTDGNAR